MFRLRPSDDLLNLTRISTSPLLSGSTALIVFMPPSNCDVESLPGEGRVGAVPSLEVCRYTGSHIHNLRSARQPAIPSSDAEGNRELTCIYISIGT